MIRRLGWGAVAAVAALPLVLSWLFDPLGPAMVVSMLAFAAVAAVRPFTALLTYAALSPLSTVIFLQVARPLSGYQFAEALALALIAGWAIERTVRPRPLELRPVLPWTVAVLATLALSWVAIEIVIWKAHYPETALLPFIGASIRNYLPNVGEAPARPALLWVEGGLLLLVAADACAGDQRRRDTVLRMMVLGAAAAASLSLLRYIQVVMAQPDPWTAAVNFFAHLRTNTQYADRNAAGSYFAMMLVVAGALAARRHKWSIPAALIALGAWFSGSRLALGSAVLGGAVAMLLFFKGRGRRVLIPVMVGLALIATATLAGWQMYPEGRNFLARKSLVIRVGLARAGLQMAADHPVFGVGPGRFYELSNRYAGETLVPYGYTHENAHNNFIQVLAELGVPGLILFLMLVTLPLREAWRSAPALSRATVGLLGGLAAYLISSLGGHPLLTQEAAYPFWLALGLAAVPLAQTPLRPNRIARYAAVIAIALLLGSVPWRTSAALRNADMASVSTGLSPWQRDEYGRLYRTADVHSTFYVAADARTARIPLRSTLSSAAALEVRIMVDGKEADRVLVPSDAQWHEKLLLLRRIGGRAYSRIDVDVVRTTGTGGHIEPGMLQVGKAEVEW